MILTRYLWLENSSCYGPVLSVNEGGRGCTLWVAPWCRGLRLRLWILGKEWVVR